MTRQIPYPDGYTEKFQPIALLFKVQYKVVPWLRQQAVASGMRNKIKQERLMWLDDADDWLNTIIMHIETRPLFSVMILDQNFVQTDSQSSSRKSILYRHRGQPWLDVLRYILNELLKDLSNVESVPKKLEEWNSLILTLLAGFPERPINWVKSEDLIWIKEETK